MSALASHGHPAVQAPLSPHRQTAVHPPNLHVKGVLAALRLLDDLGGTGPVVADLLVAAQQKFDGTAVKADVAQGFDHVHHHGYAALHVQNTGAAGHAVLDGERSFRVCSVGKDGVQMPAQKDGSAAAPCAVCCQQDRHPAGRDQPTIQALLLQAAHRAPEQSLDAVSLSGTGLKVDQVLPKMEHLVPVAVNVLADLCHILVHVCFHPLCVSNIARPIYL